MNKLSRPSKPQELKPKERLFVTHYLASLNATRAAIEAGYSKASARVLGHRLLTKVHISAAIEKSLANRLTKFEITTDNVLHEIAKLSFSNMADYIKVQADGTGYIDLSALTRDQAAALSEVETTEYIEGRGENAADVRKVKIKLADKGMNLERLCKYALKLGSRLEITGKDGAPLQPPKLVVNFIKLQPDDRITS